MERSSRAWMLYVAPMVAFLVITQLEGLLPDFEGGPHPIGYPLVYAAKVLLVGAVAWACRGAWRDLRPSPGASGFALSVLLGLAVTAVWIGLDGVYPSLPLQGERQAFRPDVLSSPLREAFLAIRLLGLVALVPLIEELFWRSFLIRWIAQSDWKAAPLGRVTPMAALVTSALFALAHPEWLPAFVAGLAWAWLLLRTGSVLACVVSHAVANLALGIYVLLTGAWRFW